MLFLLRRHPVSLSYSSILNSRQAQHTILSQGFRRSLLSKELSDAQLLPYGSATHVDIGVSFTSFVS